MSIKSFKILLKRMVNKVLMRYILDFFLYYYDLLSYKLLSYKENIHKSRLFNLIIFRYRYTEHTELFLNEINTV